MKNLREKSSGNQVQIVMKSLQEIHLQPPLFRVVQYGGMGGGTNFVTSLIFRESRANPPPPHRTFVPPIRKSELTILTMGGARKLPRPRL